MLNGGYRPGLRLMVEHAALEILFHYPIGLPLVGEAG